MELEKKVKNKKLFTKWSPINEEILKGWPLLTIFDGNIIFDKGKVDTITKREGGYF